MSAFNGLLAIRAYSAAYPGIPRDESIAILKRLSPDDAYHDYNAALILDGWVEADRDHSDVPQFWRHAIWRFIEQVNPWWLRLASFGRERLRAALSNNEAQCFDAAKLFLETPERDILEWWDSLAHVVRAQDDINKLLQGREAEQLTIAYETERLARLGIARVPRWIAIDDNGAGYDVQSFDVGPVEPIVKLIEVKSCARQPVEIFLTRNEWQTAVEREPHYWFHVWLLPQKELIELTPSDIEPHIPQNRGQGVWEITRIALSPR